MIRTEQISDTFVRHYSDAKLKIQQVETGAIYDDAVDVIPCRYTYMETNEPIKDVDAEEVLNILLGEETE